MILDSGLLCLGHLVYTGGPKK